MSKRKRKHRLDRETYLARERRKAEIRAHPPAPIPEEFKGVTVREPASYQPSGFAEAMAIFAGLMIRTRMKRHQDFFGPVRRKGI